MNSAGRNSKSTSVLDRYQAALGYASDMDYSESTLQRDQLLFENLSLKELPPIRGRLGIWPMIAGIIRSKILGWGLVPIVACAASLLLFLPTTEQIDVLRPKGESAILLFVESSGAVKQWDSNMVGTSNDRLLSEVIAAVDSVAYWGVKDGQNNLISGIDKFLNSKISLKAGERKAFKGSFRLSGENENEVIVVLTCPNKLGISALNSRIRDFLIQNKGNMRGWKTQMSGCIGKDFKLR